MISFKERLSLKERKRQSEVVLRKHPDRIPIIVERDPNNKNMPVIDRCKYLVPKDFSMGQLLYVVRKRIKIKPEEGLFFFVGNSLVATSSLLSELYSKNKDIDNFLYINYVGESTFGGKKKKKEKTEWVAKPNSGQKVNAPKQTKKSKAKAERLANEKLKNKPAGGSMVNKFNTK